MEGRAQRTSGSIGLPSCFGALRPSPLKPDDQAVGSRAENPIGFPPQGARSCSPLTRWTGLQPTLRTDWYTFQASQSGQKSEALGRTFIT
jgi:hypothetical protein